LNNILKEKNVTKSSFATYAGSAVFAMLAVPPSFAAESLEGLNQELEELKNRIEQLQAESSRNAEAAEWRYSDSLIHLSGYSDVNYIDADSGDGQFAVGKFAPIFHYQFRDLVMLESELEFEVDEEGETEVKLEYLSIDAFLNDYITLVAGKFLSPIGQFRQNLHPSWINKLASAPPGFGHDGAAPVADIGFQLRGGFPIVGARTNYAVYISNGPTLKTEFEDGEFELDGVDAEGASSDEDGDKVIGGRFGFRPIPHLEFGFSLASGKVTVGDVEDGDSSLLSGEGARDYDVLGADISYQIGNISLRGEYVETEVGATAQGVAASEGARWETFYTQASYRRGQSKFEYVTRFSDFDSPHNSRDQEQWALGINYLFTNNAIFKLTYEINDGEKDSDADEDRLMLQLTYGF